MSQGSGFLGFGAWGGSPDNLLVCKCLAPVLLLTADLSSHFSSVLRGVLDQRLERSHIYNYDY